MSSVNASSFPARNLLSSSSSESLPVSRRKEGNLRYSGAAGLSREGRNPYEPVAAARALDVQLGRTIERVTIRDHFETRFTTTAFVACSNLKGSHVARYLDAVHLCGLSEIEDQPDPGLLEDLEGVVVVLSCPCRGSVSVGREMGIVSVLPSSSVGVEVDDLLNVKGFAGPSSTGRSLPVSTPRAGVVAEDEGLKDDRYKRRDGGDGQQRPSPLQVQSRGRRPRIRRAALGFGGHNTGCSPINVGEGGGHRGRRWETIVGVLGESGENDVLEPSRDSTSETTGRWGLLSQVLHRRDDLSVAGEGRPARQQLVQDDPD